MLVVLECLKDRAFDSAFDSAFREVSCGVLRKVCKLFKNMVFSLLSAHGVKPIFSQDAAKELR